MPGHRIEHPDLQEQLLHLISHGGIQLAEED
jgi:hypothetical protein